MPKLVQVAHNYDISCVLNFASLSNLVQVIPIQLLPYSLVQVVRKLVQVANNSAISCPIKLRFSRETRVPKRYCFNWVQVVQINLQYFLVQVVRNLVQVAHKSGIFCPMELRFSGKTYVPKRHWFDFVKVVKKIAVLFSTGGAKISTGSS